VLFALARSMIESRDYLASLWDRRHALESVPLTLLWGMRDPAFGPAVLRRWRETFPAATVKEFPDAGHWPHEELPTAFALSVQGALGGATRNSTVSNF
jgi:haloalkane dehalogenase